MPVNMSYCRFENTLAALQECNEALGENGLGELSKSEQEAAEDLIALCQAIADQYGEPTHAPE